MFVYAFATTLSVIGIIGAFLWYQFAKDQDSTFAELSNGEKPFGLIDIVLTVIFWLGVQVVVITVSQNLWDWHQIDELNPTNRSMLMAMVAVGQLFGVGILSSVFRVRYGSLDRVLGLGRSNLVAHLLTGLAWFAMVVPALLCLQALLALWIPYEHSTLDSLQDNFSTLTLLVGWLGATVAAPICEEVVFRGVLQGWFQRLNRFSDPSNSMLDITGGWPDHESISRFAADRKLNHDWRILAIQFWFPIAASSAIFGLMHAGQGAAPFVLFFFGLVLGYLYRKTGSIVPCITLHFALNAFSMLWASLEAAFA